MNLNVYFLQKACLFPNIIIDASSTLSKKLDDIFVSLKPFLREHNCAYHEPLIVLYNTKYCAE